GSSLSEGHVRAVRGGDRLPWMKIGNGPEGGLDNFTPLNSIDWQGYLYCGAPAQPQGTCSARKLAPAGLSLSAAADGAGLQRDAVYLVRPDGYVALADANGGATAITSYLDARKITLSK